VPAVCFTENPSKLGLPSLHDKDQFWEPFLQACSETHTAVCMHIGSSSTMHLSSPDSPPACVAASNTSNSMDALTDWLFSGSLVRYPELRIALSESQVGWIPYHLERCDHVWLVHRAWGEIRDRLPEPPSHYYYRQVYGCLFDDAFGIENIKHVGEDNVTFETDYPHLDGTWPHSKEVAEKMTTSLTDEQTYKLLRGNAIRLLNLDLV
jgi:predicted TIM-barrel fold metal-dependent hydrolase